MSWFSSSTNETEVAKEHYFPFIAVDFNFPSGHYRFWTGMGDLTISGNTYTGTGDIGSISGESETTDPGKQKRVYSLSGVDPSSVDESDIDDSFGRSVTEYLGFLNIETRALLDTPEIFWEGRNDSFRRVDGPAPIIEATAEHRMAILDRSDGWLYTHEHQQQFYPSGGDNGYDQVNAIALKKVIWSGDLVDPAVQRSSTIAPDPVSSAIGFLYGPNQGPWWLHG